MAAVISLFLGVVPAMLYASLIYWLDRYEKEPLLLLGGVFIWGAVFAAGGAYILNTIFGLGVFYIFGSELASNIATGSISAPLVEESLKGFAVLVVFLVFRKEFDNLLDGVVYAGIAALGFAATENTIYIYRGYLEGGASGLVFLTFVRNILVGWQHPFYTAFIGIGLAVSRNSRWTLVKLFAPVVGWGLAVMLHAVHNTAAVFVGGYGDLAVMTIVEWTGWLFMLGLIVWFNYQERKFIKQYLLEEVDLGVITPKQYKTATSALAASGARLRGLSSGRFFATNRFYQECYELAHKKRQLAELEEEKMRPVVERIRADLRALSSKAVS